MADTIETGDELFLLDGNSLAYRAFFALPESIATADGRPTNAIYGLASMLGKIVVEHKPAGLIAAWDAGMSGREKTYDLYKAQRPPRPDLLREQWPHLMPLVEAFGYTNVRVEGYEADDVIGTLARQAQEAGIPVMVVSGDRDVYQLVGDGIRVMTTSRGVTETKIYDRDGVIERYGVPPELVTDLIGLKGDTSDNIPGVPGIGEKTGAQLLQEFGSLEEVLANVEKISGAKRKQNLVEHAEDARVSKQLATLQFDVETGHRLRRGDGRQPRPQHPARVHARVRAAGGDGKARGGPARRRRRSRPQRRDRARGRGGRGHARGPARGRRGDGDRRRPLGRGAGRPDRRRLLDPRRARGRARRPPAHRPRPEVARRRSPRPARRRRPRGGRARARPRHDDRRLPARAAAAHLRAGRARRRRGHRPRRGGGDRRRRVRRRPARPRRGAGGRPRPRRGGAPGRGPRRRPAAPHRGARADAAAARGRAAAGPRPRRDGAGGAEARRRAAGRGRGGLRRADRDAGIARSSSSPRRSSRSARRSRSARSSSRSSG